MKRSASARRIRKNERNERVATVDVLITSERISNDSEIREMVKRMSDRFMNPEPEHDTVRQIHRLDTHTPEQANPLSR